MLDPLSLTSYLILSLSNFNWILNIVISKQYNINSKINYTSDESVLTFDGVMFNFITWIKLEAELS